MATDTSNEVDNRLMDCSQVRERFGKVMSDLLWCKTVDDTHLMVASPFPNLDGDHPEVHIIRRPNGDYLLTDLGETMRWLANNNVDGLEGETRREILTRVEMLLGIPEVRGRFQIEVKPGEFDGGLQRMFQALSFVGDMVFTAKPQEDNDFKNIVSDHFRSLDGLQIERKVSFHGESRRSYTADIVVKKTMTLYVALVSASSKSYAQAKVDHTFAMWTDASPALRKLSIIDDRRNYVETGDVALLKRFPLVMWSRPGDLDGKVSELLDRPVQSSNTN